MPTITISMPMELMLEIQAFEKTSRQPSFSKAVQNLVKIGLRTYNAGLNE